MIVGIDLGTSTSEIAYINEKGQPEPIPNHLGSVITPSAIYINELHEPVIGLEAREKLLLEPQNTFIEVKRMMGQGKTLSARGKEYTPIQLSSFILQYLADCAKAYLNQEIDRAVITVPAYFNDAQRQATKDAGKIAGLEVLRIINEPTAAALAYGLDKKKSGTVVVYDLGGGTFDVSILEIGDGVFEVKSTNGDTSLGGENFDEKIMEYLLEEFKKENAIDLSKDKLALQRLKEAAEKAKIELSSAMQTEINLPFITADASGAKHLSIKLSRAKLESLVESLVEKTMEPCRLALKDAGILAGDISEVILVGGMTRMPKIAEKVKEFFGKEPHKGVNPDEVVAIGAAIQGGVLQGDVKDVLLLDVTPLSLGLETLGGVFTRLIERNTTIPTKKSQVFSTAENNQSAVTIRVFQGERQMVVDNKLLGQFDLVGIAPAPRGIPQIEVTFDIDANGIVSVSAKDKGTGKEHQIQIQSSSGLSEAEIERMVKEAEANAEADKAKRDHVEAINNADTMIAAVEKSMADLGDKVPADLKSQIEAAIKEITDSKETASTEDLKAKTENLSTLSMKIGELLYAQQQAQQGGAQGDGAGQQGGAEDPTIVDGDFKEK
jgi:molecular chaperone DnaK